jgi:hypothetical protein
VGQGACVPGRDQTGRSSKLFAFLQGPKTSELALGCHVSSSKAQCAPLKAPEFETFGLLVCSCSDSNSARLRADVTRFAKDFSLHGIEVIRSSAGWTIKTGDVKLLPNKPDRRDELVAKLNKTPFVLSAADQESPYRIFIRRKDGNPASAKDLVFLKSLLGIQVEIETIHVRSLPDSGSKDSSEDE